MNQLDRAKSILDEMRVEVAQAIQNLHNATNLAEAKSEVEKLIAYITVLSLILSDMVDPHMHRMYWPNH